MSDFHAVFEMSMPIRWGDMDAFGHVNNTVYFRYMEQVRISWFEQLGMAGSNADGQGPVIVNASMEFLKQLHYPGDVIGRMTVGHARSQQFRHGLRTGARRRSEHGLCTRRRALRVDRLRGGQVGAGARSCCARRSSGRRWSKRPDPALQFSLGSAFSFPAAAATTRSHSPYRICASAAHGRRRPCAD